MTAARRRDDTAPVACDSDACPHCGTAPGARTLLTSMARYYACGNCATRWSVARNWLPASVPRTV
jgi:formate dehydrogenase maturation protein FdhE